MAYQKQVWQNSPSQNTPISATRLNHLETQYDESVKYTDSVVAKIPTGNAQLPPEISTSRMEIISHFPVREGGETSWPQGFDVNYDENELYVSNISGAELRIDVRDITSGNRKSFRTFPVTSGGWTESLSWFRNASGHLCFIVWPTAPASTSKSSEYAIVNYTQGTMSATVPINGKWRGCRDGDNFITGWVNPSQAWEFYVYSWESIITSAPLLLNTVTLSNAGDTAFKVQGIASVSGSFFLVGGDQAGVPGVTSYDPNGNLVLENTWPRSEFGKMVNKFVPGEITRNDFLYESEGATNQGGNLHTLHIVNNTPDITGAGTVVIVRHGTAAGVPVAASPARALNTPWEVIPVSALASGWTQTSTPLKARIRNGTIEWSGAITNSSFTGGFTVAVTLSGNLAKFAPKSAEVFNAGGNTSTARSIEANDAGTMRVWSAAATGAWLYFSSVRYAAV